MIYSSKTMHLHVNDGVAYLTFPQIEEIPLVSHAFSTRLGGVSQGEFTSMNLSFGRGDPEENVLENYRRLCRAANLPYEGLVASSQDHHTEIRRVGKRHAGLGIWKPKDRQSVDGLLTDEPGVTLVTYYADCVPLFFVDPVHKAVGLAHAGWRGTVAGIGEKMVRRMKDEFGSNPSDLVAAIGPSIGPCCYQVDAPVQRQFANLEGLTPESFLSEEQDGKFMLNLWEVNRQILVRAGIRPEHLTITDLCTRCNHGLLFSHRATGGKRGGLAALIGIREEI